MNLLPAPAIFLDRDGTLMEEVHYCRDPEDVRVFPGVSGALDQLHAAGFKNVIITNQSGLARGIIGKDEYEAVHAELLRQIGEGRIDATYFCPELPTAGSPRRKPAPGMVFEAEAALRLDLARSWFIGDKPADIECGQNAGVRTVLVQTGYGRQHLDLPADHIANDLVEAVRHILMAG